MACVLLVNRPVDPKRSLVLKSLTIHTLPVSVDERKKRKKRSEKAGICLAFVPFSQFYAKRASIFQ